MKRLLALLMFLLLGMPAFAQQPGNTDVSFGSMAPAPQGARLIHYNIPDGTSKGWLDNGVRKDAENSPDVGFLPNPLKDRANFLVVSSDFPRFFQGFQAVTSTTHTTQVSGRGTLTDNYGGMWDFTYHGQVATAATTHETVSHQINSNTLYVNTYYDDGALVSQRYDVYSRQTESAPYAGTGYYFGNLFKAINARGRLITSAIQRITGPAQKKAKSD
jgi:hypothetical protein